MINVPAEKSARALAGLTRYSRNPIITPGSHSWRAAATFNPGVIYENGRFYLFERAAGGLRPFQCRVGLWSSADGFNFELESEQPVFTPEEMGYKDGAIEDPRVVKIDDFYYMVFAFRPYAYHCNPTAVGVPEYAPMVGELDKGINNTRSGLARSRDMHKWEFLGFTTEPEVDDRDNVLFPGKVNGKFALFRRPQGADTRYSAKGPSMWISYSDDLKDWSEPELIAEPAYEWEGAKIGAAAPPVLTDHGWLTLYHGVDAQSIYRVGAMLLDAEDPAKVLARTAEPVLQPEQYYERCGAVIPNVVFPTGTVVVDETLYVYYGCADTCIAVATASLPEFCEQIIGG